MTDPRYQIDELIYSEVRFWGSRGRRVRARSLMNGPNYSSYLVRLTEEHTDIAEEDDGSIFSIYDWEQIRYMDRFRESEGRRNKPVTVKELGDRVLTRWLEEVGDEIVAP